MFPSVRIRYEPPRGLPFDVVQYLEETTLPLAAAATQVTADAGLAAAQPTALLHTLLEEEEDAPLPIFDPRPAVLLCAAPETPAERLTAPPVPLLMVVAVPAAASAPMPASVLVSAATPEPAREEGTFEEQPRGATTRNAVSGGDSSAQPASSEGGAVGDTIFAEGNRGQAPRAGAAERADTVLTEVSVRETVGSETAAEGAAAVKNSAATAVAKPAPWFRRLARYLRSRAKGKRQQ